MGILIFAFALLIFSLLILIIGWFKTSYFLWPLKTHTRFQNQKRVFIAAIFWASLLISISLLLSLMLSDLFNIKFDTTKLTTSSSLPYALFALFFSIYAFLNTLIIQQRQRQQVGSFAQLLDELYKKFDQWEHLNEDEKKQKFFFMVEYTPALGSISEQKRYCDFAKKLWSISRSSIQVRVVCYPDDLIVQFHEHLRVSRNKQIREGRTILEEVRWLIGDLDGARDVQSESADSVWRSNKIGPLHLIVTPDIVYQYVVIPEFNGTKNKLIGFKSEDAFVIEFFKQTYFDFESEAVTPLCTRISDDKIELTFPTEQERIKELELYLSDSENVIVSDETLSFKQEVTNPTIKSILIKHDNLGNAKYLKVVLVKNNGAKSQPSKLVTISGN